MKAEGGGQKDETAVATRQRAPLTSEFLVRNCALLEGLIAVSADLRLAELFPGRFYSLATGKDDTPPAVACPAVRYATTQDRQKYDIVQSIRTLTLLREEHPVKQRGGRFHFRTPAEMALTCKEHPTGCVTLKRSPTAATLTCHLANRNSPRSHRRMVRHRARFLHQACASKACKQRYGSRERVTSCRKSWRNLGHHQRRWIRRLFPYYLGFSTGLPWKRGIDWITMRQRAADSLVCYCLGISGVCPIRFDLYFRRFLNKDRMALNKLPDIDIDFAHDFKDDVVKLIFEKYGRNHCAVVGGFSTFQARSAFAEVAKVLGVSEREVRKFTDHFPWSFGGGWVPAEHTPSGGAKIVEMLRASPENRDLPLDEEPYRTALHMAEFLDGVPRYPKMHPCGLVLSRQPMHELTPTFISNKGLATTHFDMDAVEAIGLVKMDILAQGGLAAMRDVKAMLDKRGIDVDMERCLARDKADGRLLLGNPQAPEPWQDPQVWAMIASGGARAVHHIESPAMTSLCRMCNVSEIDGLVAIVSVIRPGAANEGKKLAFTRRYQGLEPVTYPHPSLEACLRSTYGLVVYEEHILQMSEAFAGLNPGRADVLRRALNKQNHPMIEKICGEFIQSALARGHSPKKDCGSVGPGHGLCRLRLLQGAQHGLRCRGVSIRLAQEIFPRRVHGGGALQRGGVLSSHCLCAGMSPAGNQFAAAVG